MTTDYLTGMHGTIEDAVLVASDPTLVMDQLNALLRGEIAAAETYRMAIDKMSKDGDSASLGLLGEIQEEHGRAAQAIRDRVRELGGEPSDASGAWGAWAKTVQGLADMLGTSTGLKALKEGEEHGLKDYLSAADGVDLTSRQLIKNQFIPAQGRHIVVIDQLLAGVNIPS